ncbi:MAG: glycosyl hydrolase family 28-related protein, partial [Phycisphaerae bacterium]
MSQENKKINPDSPERIFDRRRFLGGAALAGLTAPIIGGAGMAVANVPPPPEPVSDNFGEPYLNVRNFGARGDGKTDDTAAIQKALDAAGKQGGNVVLLPRGEYLVRGALHVPDDVTLQGVFRAPNRGNTGQNMGSLLLATGGKGKPDGTPFISLGENGTLYGVTIFYPEQTCPNPPVEYPWTVRQLS